MPRHTRGLRFWQWKLFDRRIGCESASGKRHVYESNNRSHAKSAYEQKLAHRSPSNFLEKARFGSEADILEIAKPSFGSTYQLIFDTWLDVEPPRIP